MKLTELCSIQVRQKHAAYDRTWVFVVWQWRKQSMDADSLYLNRTSLLITVKMQHKLNIFCKNCWKWPLCLSSAVTWFKRGFNISPIWFHSLLKKYWTNALRADTPTFTLCNVLVERHEDFLHLIILYFAYWCDH